jgi:eukaryotic-like serine/threonine-protein kinase
VSYELVGQVASSGVADVFLARDAKDSATPVVIKQLSADHVGDQARVRGFVDAALVTLRLNDPHIARVIEVGENGQLPFYVMEYVDGETARTLLQCSAMFAAGLPVSCVLTAIRDAAAGLRHAHGQGVFHHDLSPSKLMVGFDGTVKLIGFALAPDADHHDNVAAGDAAYWSPEQCKHQVMDARSDLFSLGIVMWEMLTGKPLFRRATGEQTIAAIAGGDIAPPSRVRPDVPAAVDAMVLRLLARPREARFQSAGELVDAIEGIAAKTFTKLSPAPLGRLTRELVDNARSADRSATTIRVAELPDATEVAALPTTNWDEEPSKTVPRSDRQVVRVAGSMPSQRRDVRTLLGVGLKPPSSPTTIPTMTRYPTTEDTRLSVEPRRRRIGWILPVVVFLVVAGATLLVLVYERSGAVASNDRPPPPPKTTVPVVSLPVAAPISAADAGSAIETDSASVAPEPLAPVAPHDATTAPPPHDSAPPVLPIKPRPHTPHVVAASSSTKLDATPPDPSTSDLTHWFVAGQFADVTNACSASEALRARSSALCTLAACRQGDAATAASWFAGVPSKTRSQVITACKTASIDLCASSPVSCAP